MTEAPVHFLLPGSIESRTGGTIYDRRIIEGLRRHGRRVEVVSLPPDFPHPSQATLARADETLAGIPDGAVAVVDGLAFGAMPDVAARHAGRLALVALVHHPLADEGGMTEEEARNLFLSEKQALVTACYVITTSSATARRLADFGVPSERIGVVEPGIDRRPPALGSGRPSVAILSVGTVTARKNHAGLVDALAVLRDLPWTLDIVGDRTREPEVAAALERRIEASRLGGRVLIHGEVEDDQLERLWHAADAFALVSRHEGYGMAIAEAVSRGLPVLAGATGAVPEVVPPGAGILVSPDDFLGLVQSLRALLCDPSVRAVMRRAALDARDRYPDWDQAARSFGRAIDRAVAR